MIYRSGNLARFTAEGEIEYLGRKDTQVNIRGFRIELGEIEAVGGAFPRLSGFVVNAFAEDEDQKELVAYYVLASSDSEPDPVALHETLKERLPPYMVPAFFEKLDTLLFMVSGKLNRSKLPAPSSARLTESGKTFVAPAEGTEAQLASLLATILKFEAISADADFFADLGANSLIMARYLGRVSKELGLKGASMRQIYENPTVQTLALAIAPAPQADTGPAEAGVTQAEAAVPPQSATNAEAYAEHSNVIELNP